MRARAGDRWIGVVLAGCVALSSGCVFGGSDKETLTSDGVDRGRIHAPDDVPDGCGDLAATDPSDLSAGRAVARCGAGAPEPLPLAQPATVRVGVRGPTEELAPLLLAQHYDEFAEEKLTVELVEYPDPEALYAALGRGEVDAVAGRLDSPFYDLVDEGSGARLVLGGPIARKAHDIATPQAGFWVRTDQVTDGDHWKDLEGDHFAVEDGIADVVASPITAVLRQDDMSLNEARLDAVGGTDAAQMLLDGQATAAWLDDPAWLRVANNARFRLVATLPASESVDGVVVGRRLVDHEGDREVGLAFVRALVRTINTYLADDYQKDDEVVEALADEIGVKPADVQATPPWLFDWELRTAGTERVQTVFIQLGAVLFEDEIAEREIVDRTLYRDVVAQLQA